MTVQHWRTGTSTQRGTIYTKWFMKRIGAKPGAHRLFIDDVMRPLWWFRKGDYMTWSQVERDMHVGFKTLLDIIDRENVFVYRVPAGLRHYRFFERKDGERLITEYGNPAARAQRPFPWPSMVKRPRLATRCRHCGKTGKQSFKEQTKAGHSIVKCGHCGRAYSTNFERPPRIESTCKWCGATTKQWRCGRAGRKKRLVRCGHCGRTHSIENPDYRQPGIPWMIRSRSQMELTVDETRERLAIAPSGREANIHADGLLWHMERYSARLEADLRSRQAHFDEEMTEQAYRCEQEYKGTMKQAGPGRRITAIQARCDAEWERMMARRMLPVQRCTDFVPWGYRDGQVFIAPTVEPTP